jgi:hypothetical protein
VPPDTQDHKTHDRVVGNIEAGRAARPELGTERVCVGRRAIRRLTDSGPDGYVECEYMWRPTKRRRHALCEHLLTNLMVNAEADEAEARAATRTATFMLMLVGRIWGLWSRM